MKLLQKGYNEIQALEVELRILEQASAPPSRPCKIIIFFIIILLHLITLFLLLNLLLKTKISIYSEENWCYNN